MTSTSAARRRLGPGPAFVLTAGVIGLCLAASALPSPLYKLYATSWHLAASTVTLVYATYCFGVLAALLLFGRVSDTWGRRPVVAVGLTGLLASMVLFLNAADVTWLFLARAIQGVSTGIAISAAGAALLELSPSGNPARASSYNVVASALGVGLGGMFGALLVQYVAHPLMTPFVVLSGLIVLLLIGLLLMPETVPRRSRTGFRITAPGVPRQIVASFGLASLGITCAWSMIGVYLGLVPTVAPTLLHSGSHLATGSAILALCGASTVPPLLARTTVAAVQVAWGAVALMVGIAMMLTSLAVASATVFIAASVMIGLGVGFAMVGSLRTVGAAAPANQRARVMAAFYVVAYAAISVPAIAAGFAVGHLGVTRTFHVFGAVIGVVLLGTLPLAIARHRDTC